MFIIICFLLASSATGPPFLGLGMTTFGSDPKEEPTFSFYPQSNMDFEGLFTLQETEGFHCYASNHLIKLTQ